MLFGSTDTFAIEAVTEPTWCLPPAVWGSMRVWCQGVELGDFAERHCGLLASYDGFTSLAQHLPSLWLPEFDGMTDDALYDHLDALLYGCRGETELDTNRTPEQWDADRATYGRFNFLTNWGEQFAHAGKPFILCRPGGPVRILHRPSPESSVQALEGAPEHFLRTIADFDAWFEAESARLLAADSD
jgi:hypothetical protein